MIIKIEKGLNNVISNNILRDSFIFNGLRYLNLIRFENSTEYQGWDKYLRTNYKIDLYQAILSWIEYIKLSNDEEYYFINMDDNILISEKLSLPVLYKLLRYGNMDIKKTNLLNNLISYSLNRL